MVTQGREIPKLAIVLCEKIYKGSHPEFFAYYLEYLVLHLPDVRLIPALRWLIGAGIVGANFHDFVAYDCAGSALELFKKVTQALERLEKTRPILRKDVV